MSHFDICTNVPGSYREYRFFFISYFYFCNCVLHLFKRCKGTVLSLQFAKLIIKGTATYQPYRIANFLQPPKNERTEMRGLCCPRWCPFVCPLHKLTSHIRSKLDMKITNLHIYVAMPELCKKFVSLLILEIQINKVIFFHL